MSLFIENSLSNNKAFLNNFIDWNYDNVKDKIYLWEYSKTNQRKSDEIVGNHIWK